MNVVMCSCFRNSVSYIPRYFDQTEALAMALYQRGDLLSLVLGYGDSTDGTDAMLFEAATLSIGARLIDCSHGGPAYTSVVDADRFKQLSYIGNLIFANVPVDAGAVIWCEADLVWEPGVIVKLINHLSWHAAAAPMVMEKSSGGFYDVFSHRLNGVNFQKYPPYFPGWPTSKMTKLTSAGSVLAMRGNIARKIVVPQEDVIVGVCRQIYENGGEVWLDPTLNVFHA